MKGSLVFTFILCGLGFDTASADGLGKEIPGTRGKPQFGLLEPVAPFIVDAQNRINLIYYEGPSCWLMIHSDDLGETWSDWVGAPCAICDWGVWTSDPAGNLYMAASYYSTEKHRLVVFTSSRDRGDHWGEMQYVVTNEDGNVPSDISLTLVEETLCLGW